MNYLAAVDGFFPDRPSGSARVAWDIAQLMRCNGHAVTLFCRKADPGDTDVVECEGVRVVRFVDPKRSALDPFKVRKQINAGLASGRKYLLETRWDVVHSFLPVEGRIVSQLLGSGPRYVYTVCSPAVLENQINWSGQGLAGRLKWWFGRGALKRLEGGVLRVADGIQAHSHFSKRAIDGFYGVGRKTHVIPHWYRADLFRQNTKDEARGILRWPRGATVLFTVRRLVPRMGLDDAIKAVAPLLREKTDLYFALAGAGRMEGELKELANSLGVSGQVWFLGRISDDMLKRCYEASDVFIIPTRALECFGIPVLEAFAYGLPVVSTDSGSLPELVKPILPDGIAPAGDVESLRQKVKGVLEGSIPVPPGPVLVDYVKRNYAMEVVGPQILRLIQG
jgi:glycosyltransferase involved in cell wall biosynthesis